MPKSNLAGAGYTVIGAEIVGEAKELQEFAERVFGSDIPERLLYKHWFELLLDIAKGMCPYCNGTAIKCGMFDVLRIEPVRLEMISRTKTYHLRPEWIHTIGVSKVTETKTEAGIFNQERCYASKMWEAVYDRLILPTEKKE